MNNVFKQISAPVKKELLIVEKKLRNYFKKYHPEVKGKILNFLRTKGKYLRPLLSFNCAYAVMGKGMPAPALDKIAEFACVLEMLHSASLIHDDVIDKDEWRRGKRSLNFLYGNKDAVLAGDILYITALDILNQKFSADILKKVIHVIYLMCLGQMGNPVFRKGKKEKLKYIETIRNKTASPMQLACIAPVLVSKKNNHYLKELSQYGINLGLLYQITDDKEDKDAYIPLSGAEIKEIADKAEKSLSTLPDSVYKDNLFKFIDLVYRFK